MKLGVVQLEPRLQDVAGNIKRATDICSGLNAGDVDLLCFPEMAFTGYVFDDAAAIQPFLERPPDGPTFKFCSSLARRLRCFVLAGYPERLSPDEVELGDGSHHVGANSAIVVDPEGKLLANYRKTNLFDNDKCWAKPGTGFLCLDLPSPLNKRMSLGICMDLNVAPPHVWTSLEGPYELATFATDNESDILVILCAWLASDQEVDYEANPSLSGLPDYRNIRFWSERLRPLWAAGLDSEPEEEDEPADKETLVVICNRIGRDKETLFAGSSCIFRMSADGPALLGALSSTAEQVALWSP